jgi:protein O-GlcNAc transferase
MLLHLLKFLRDQALSLIKRNPVQGARADPASGSPDPGEVAVATNSTAEECNELGITLLGSGRPDAALEAFDRAVAVNPAFAPAYVNRGAALLDLQRFEDALRSFEHAILLDPASAESHVHHGNALSELGRHESALDSYERAIALKPGFAEAYYNRGDAFDELNRPAEALESFAHALRLKPGYEFLFGLWLHTKMRVCDWRNIEADFSRLAAMIERGEKTGPFQVLATPSSLAVQKKAAETWIGARHPASNALPAISKRAASDRIRIGYFSADFQDHATSRLMAELFERHDRSRFEVTAFSFGARTSDAMRNRLLAAFDRFVEVSGLTDLEAAKQARDLEIDIAIDLKGFCKGSRTGIFALRAAPIQVNYLGYPGTMGAGYIDYLIADSTLIPPAHRQYYSERIAYLPHSYQPNDTKRRISEMIVARADAGLPQSGFVFCCFNNNYKIVPEMFDRWMRILGRVDGSVLWLLEDNAAAAVNLRAEAIARGIAPGRLVFAPRVALPDHLARHRLADLFLDTLPCNAHTTASDALWAGLPVLTCLGDTFAGRVAASLLRAIGLPELVAPTLAHYEELAVDLANDRDKLGRIRQTLDANRTKAPLFRPALLAKYIETAYATMHERYRAGEPPDHFHVQEVEVNPRQAGEHPSG